MRISWMAAIACVLILGCGEPSGPTGQAPPPPAPPAPPAEVKSPEPIKAGDDVVKAETGVGKKGRGYGGGIITEPIRQRFRAEQAIHFQRIEGAMRDFKILKERLPKSHEEFMTDVIEANGITLPDLPSNEEYVYDPEKGELMVRRPK